MCARRAFGPPIFTARLRTSAADFRVVEELDIPFSGDGEHDYLWIEKTGANTGWVAERLARFAGVRIGDVGYSGLKDRHAVTRQWFSVRRSKPVGWAHFAAAGVTILDQHRHRRKLKRGAHRGNAFRVALRGPAEAHDAELHARLERIRSSGVPNYFGPQRFGRDNGNLRLARRLSVGEGVDRRRRGFAISAARSLMFNAVLDARIRRGDWNRLLPGDLANLDGTGSVFPVAAVDAGLISRCQRLDIHPSATLWGRGAPRTGAVPAEVEQRVAANLPEYTRGLEAAGVDAGTRALRVRIAAFEWEIMPDVLWLGFSLRRGGFATSVIREIADVMDSTTA